MLLHKAACGAESCTCTRANVHDHRRRRKWRDCESFPTGARRTNCGLTVWSMHYSPLGCRYIISHFAIWWQKCFRLVHFIKLTNKRQEKKTHGVIFFVLSFLHQRLCQRNSNPKWCPPVVKKRQHLHLPLSSQAEEWTLAFDSSRVFILDPFFVNITSILIPSNQMIYSADALSQNKHFI